MSQTDQENDQGVRERIESYAKLIGAVAGAISVIWVIVRFFIPIGDVDLTVWVQQEIPIILPELPTATDELSLTLTYEGELISSATLLDIKIFNSGSKLIGEKDPWQLTLRTEDAARLVLLGDLRTEPPNLEAQVVKGSLSDALDLQVGLFNPDDSIDLRLLVIEPENVDRPAIVAETRVPNLKAPFLTRKPEIQRLENALAMPIFIVVLVCWIGVGVWNQVQTGWSLFRRGTARSILGGLFIFLLWLTFLSVGTTLGLSWVLARIVSFVISK